MQKWEYNCAPFQGSDELRTLVNKLGDDGWELVTVLPEIAGGRGLIIAKRPNEQAWSKPSCAKGE